MKTSSKSSVKVVAKKATAKVAVKAKTVLKAATPAAVKAKAKPAAKVVKEVTKPVKSVKSAIKTPAKVAPKAPIKTAIKPKTVAKAPVKPVNKPKSRPVAVKAAGKPAVKSTAQKPAKVVTKPATKVSAPVAAKALKAAASAASSPTVKAAASAAAKASPKSLSKEVLKSAKAIAKAPIAPSSEKVKPAAKVAASTAAPAVVTASVVAPVAAGDVPARATRPSARLAQITVPSMAQSVASTAAKASYLHNTPPQVMMPVFTASVKKDAKLANNWKTKKVEELTDAEILAMSDDDYMNDTQKAYFRRKLVLLKEDMLANAGQTTENLREDTVVVPDPADRATIEEEHALELRTRDRERKLLKKIEQSINHIDSGDYGYCDETGEPIGVGRLLARPTATLSLEAQQRRELKQKMFGD